MTFDTIRRYIATRETADSSVGSLPLSTVRAQIQENEADYERLKGHLRAKRAEKKAEEVRELAAKQKQARDEKSHQVAALEELRKSQMLAKEREVRAGLERERVLRQLKGVNEERLTELAKERAEELRVIGKEREALEEREREMDVVVRKVEADLGGREARMTERSDRMKAEMRKAEDAGKEGNGRSDEKGVREALAKDYGRVRGWAFPLVSRCCTCFLTLLCNILPLSSPFPFFLFFFSSSSSTPFSPGHGRHRQRAAPDQVGERRAGPGRRQDPVKGREGRERGGEGRRG